MDLSPVDLRHCLDQALSIIDRSDTLILERYRSGFSHRLKSDGSFVTEIDLETETLIREELSPRFPDHAIEGEELEDVRGKGSLRWMIDPIDGTASLRHRVPLFGTLLALLDGDVPLVGVISLPALGERAWAARGAGAFVNGETITLPDPDAEIAFDREIIAIGERRQFIGVGRESVFDAVMAAHPGVRVYSDCFGHLLAARGAVAAMIDYGLRIWDWAPSRVIVEEAGGRFEIVEEHVHDGVRRYDVILGSVAGVEWAKQQL